MISRKTSYRYAGFLGILATVFFFFVAGFGAAMSFGIRQSALPFIASVLAAGLGASSLPLSYLAESFLRPSEAARRNRGRLTTVALVLFLVAAGACSVVLTHEAHTLADPKYGGAGIFVMFL